MKFCNLLFNGKAVDLEIEGNRISSIAPSAADGGKPRLILSPAFYNTHTHLAMSLLRGFADDMRLMDWLQNKIWPLEAKMSGEDVYIGTRLAAVEMIRSGCVFANDMYWFAQDAARAAQDAGIRCAVSVQTIETGGPGKNDPRNVESARLLENLPRNPREARVFAAYAPHAVYTVCPESLKSIAARAARESAFIHVHASETAVEVDGCRKAHGCSPVELLDRCGCLGERTILAHCVHLSDDDVSRIASTRSVIAENTQSNMKLASGIFPYARAVSSGGCRHSIGTDGACSNNSLSMFAEMKAAALLAKAGSGDPACAPAGEVLRAATRGGAEAFGLDAGEIRPGALADFILLKADAPCFTPGFGFESDMVYAAETSAVDTVVCDGRVLMRNGVIPGEQAIIEEARAAAKRLVARL